MPPRIDSASRLISASLQTLYRAFADSGALESWLPPDDTTGTMLHFDFRDGGLYRMRLTCTKPEQGRGKTSENTDEVEVQLTKIEDGRRIEQEITFKSEDSSSSGVVRMIWTFQPQNEGTLVPTTSFLRTARALNLDTPADFALYSETHDDAA